MTFSRSELQEMALRSQPLYERGQKISKSSPLFDEWAELIADGNHKRFSRRFSWDNSLFTKSPDKQKPLPPWTKKLNNLLEFLDKQRLKPSSNKQFKELLYPFVLYAKKELKISSKLIDNKAFTSLEDSLLKRFNKLFSQTLQIEFKVFEMEKSLNLHNPNSKGFYNAFVKSFSKERWRAFFKEYCVAARLLFQIIDFWHESIGEFCKHLENDFQELQINFSQKKLGKVVKIETSGSDFHKKGKEVFIIHFSSGCKIIYKPKSLKIDIAYFSLLSFIQNKEPLFSFKILKVLDRRTYGWTEFVPFKPCSSFKKLKQYYFNSGTLACILYLLRGSDCHLENIIACGSKPVLIDLETLFQPKIPPSEMVAPITLELQQSIIFSGLLPFKDSLIGDIDVSGFAGFIPKGKNNHLPSFDGKKAYPLNFIPQIKKGFQKMYLFLQKHPDEVFRYLQPFKKISARLVFRGTFLYSKLLTQSLTPDCLRDALFRSKTIDILSRPLLFSQDRSPFWPVVSKEHKDLDRLDIPYFTFSSTSLRLRSTPQVFLSTGFNEVKKLLFNLNEKDLHFQLHLLSSSLKTRFAKILSPKKIYLKKEKSFSSDQIQDKAISIGKLILNQRIQLPPSSSWIQAGPSPLENLILEQTDLSLYSGAGGIAIFLSALYSVTNKDEFAQGAISALEPLKMKLTTEPLEMEINAIGLGGMVGLGSYIYTLAKVGQFLNNPQYFKDAQGLAHHITPRRIEKDGEYDVIGGSSGTILALLALHDLHPNSLLIEKARLLAQHLLENSPRSLCGFSHGASGISYSLLKLYQKTKEKKYLQAAKDGLIYENSHFCPEKNNWIDLRPHENSFKVAWCHGAVGIGLCRLASLPILGSFVKKDLNAALLTAQKSPLSSADHLCCGNFARLDFLSSAGRLLARPDLLSFSHQLISFLLAREQKRGDFSFFDTPNLPNFSLFRGVSGVGYTLLRFLYPQNIPSILLLE